MSKLTAKIELTYEYGHSGNRPAESFKLKELVDRLNEVLNEEAKSQTGLSHWYLVAAKVE
jgi:hypothetical protein